MEHPDVKLTKTRCRTTVGNQRTGRFESAKIKTIAKNFEFCQIPTPPSPKEGKMAIR
jgi:hypothetical protein